MVRATYYKLARRLLVGGGLLGVLLMLMWLWSVLYFSAISPNRIILLGDSNYYDNVRLQEQLRNNCFSNGKGFENQFKKGFSRCLDVIYDNPWLNHYYARLIWPRTLVVKLSENKPVARWLDEGYLTVTGKMFAAGENPNIVDLPVLFAFARDPADMLRDFNAANSLFKKVGRHINKLYFSLGGEWEITLDNKTRIVTNPPLVGSIERAIPHLVKRVAIMQGQWPRSIDLRYPAQMAIVK